MAGVEEVGDENSEGDEEGKGGGGEEDDGGPEDGLLGPGVAVVDDDVAGVDEFEEGCCLRVGCEDCEEECEDPGKEFEDADVAFETLAVGLVGSSWLRGRLCISQEFWTQRTLSTWT